MIRETITLYFIPIRLKKYTHFEMSGDLCMNIINDFLGYEEIIFIQTSIPPRAYCIKQKTLILSRSFTFK